MTVETPCSDPSNDSNDWFIEKDGKQYRDDEVLTEEELAEVDSRVTIGKDGSDWDKLVLEAEEEKIRLALIRRRKAREACYECPMRLQCLDARLETKVEHGIWGGYYPEELRKIEDLREERLRQRGGVD